MHSPALSSDFLSAEAIRARLDKSCKLCEIQVHAELASTNTTAKECALNGAPHGTVIIAEHQTAGRGRMGRSFYSPDAKGVYLSVILRLNESADVATHVTPAAAVAVARAIQAVYGIEAQIKWVNDVYLGGRKVCGILTEASMDFASGKPAFLILGIGINASQAEFPEELRSIVTAISEHTDKPIDRNELIAALLNALDPLLKTLSTPDFMEEYRNRSMLIGKAINILRGGEVTPAIAEGINNEGHLLVRLESGELRALSSGEVSVRLQ